MALIDTLNLPRRQVNTLRNLHAKVNTRGETVTKVTEAQFAAIQAAYDATKAAGKVCPVMLAHAKNLGLKL